MDLQAIINAAADDADEFLAGVTSMTEARPAIRDYLNTNHPELTPAEGARVVAGLLAVLDEEGFFDGSGGSAIPPATNPPAEGFAAADEE